MHGEARSGSAQAAELPPAIVNVESIHHHFITRTGDVVQALDDVSLAVRPGEFVALVGPSGCGKTTLLNMLAGLVQPASGTVHVHGERVTKPNKRVGMMFARDCLLPWRTAATNVEMGLEIRRVTKSERHERALATLGQLGLNSFADHYPAQLSQGMRQRVAMARTLVCDPELILLDEPFAALDAQSRTQIQAEFVRIWEDQARTVVLVTHDVTEALALADRVVVMAPRPGRITDIIEVPFPRPRDVAGVRFTSEMQELSRHVWDRIQPSVNVAKKAS
jgi:NitT/TauT family transport system ATP-binding protein